jgi:integrase
MLPPHVQSAYSVRPYAHAFDEQQWLATRAGTRGKSLPRKVCSTGAGGFRRIRIHDLKHTFGRRLRAVGVSFETRQVLLGHHNGSVTTHYSAAEIAELLDAVSRINATRSTAAMTLLRAVA